MNLKKILILIMIAALLVFAGCAKDESDETDSAVSVSAEDTATANETKDSGVGYGEGDRMVDFTVPLIDGGEFTLSDNLGKAVFINLYATWCPPCVGEMPDIQELYDTYADDVVFVVIDVGEDKATAQGFAEENDYTLPFAYSVEGTFLPDYNIEFIPQTFVVGTDGTIVEHFPGASNTAIFSAAIEKAMETK